MPRKRSKVHDGLPKGWRYKHNAYRYRPPPGLRHLIGGKTEVVIGKTLSEAYRRFGELIAVFDDPRFMNALFDRYMAEVTPTKSPRTQKDEYVILRQLRDVFGHNPVSAITPVHCFQVRDKLTSNHGPTYANRCLEKLSHVFTKGIEWGACADHPMKGKVTKNKLRPERRYVEDWEIEEALKVAPPLIEGYVNLKMMTGLRMSDMLSLRWSDVKEDGIHVQPRKTAHSSGKRLVILWDDHGVLKAVLESIKGLRRKTGSIYLFSNRRGQPYIKPDGTTRGFQSMWQRWQDKALKETKLNERIRERWLRTKVGSDQESAEMAARILAHTDTKTTTKFYREKPEKVVAFTPSKRKNDTNKPG